MKKKVLICTFSMGIGGMENFLKNVVEKINKEKFELTFAINSEPQDKSNIIFLHEHGIKVRYVGNMRPNVFRYIKNIKKIIINEGPFDIIHTNLEYQGSIVLGVAKKYGIKKRIAHSHTTNVNVSYNKIMMPIYRLLFKKNANCFLSCGKEAGKYMFGDKIQFKIINNGINVEKFSNQNKLRTIQYKIGQIGRLNNEKNQQFSIELLRKLHSVGKYYHLYFIGDGPDKDRLMSLVAEYGLVEYVHFMGIQLNIEQLYNKFDFLLLPSLFEGLPFALLESQCSGVFTFASDNISHESDMGLKLVDFIPLEIDIWLNKILKYRINYVDTNEIRDAYRNKGFDLEGIVKELEVIYDS